ncbi:penicillin-binding protein 2 [Clostridium sp. HBUAS56017]|uniref:peptidoglycan D,D-transpeptidase FtsI family protein n=1 Tax=Clostridium sp. HBUAS56017 TaxID=2571128 RepID=UPI0011788031|nr:penicillin-binding protein 2 [Clostridium sp. HBUAS56017]
MNDFRNSVKKVMVVFLFFFVALISYIAYFQAFQAPDLAASTGNKRLWAKRNEVLRGTIYDRNGTALTTGEKTGDLTQSRKYVNGDLYAHALGYVNQKYGLTGLEDAYDAELSSYSSVETGLRTFLKDFSIDSLKEAFKTRGAEEKKVGNGVITTLDTNIQKVAYNSLGDRKGAVIALDPKTGEVLAMVSKPTYDPNNLDAAMAAANSGASENSPFMNRAVAGLYPPGSTFKPITTASALQNISGIQSRIFNDTGKLVFNSKQSLSNALGVANGDINLKTAFVKSSNFVFGTLAGELGNDKLKATAEKFGFNKTIPAEGFQISQSKFPTLNNSEVGMIAQSGIGQSSILATPMQMALVASSIANDGIMMEPTLVKEVVDKNKNSVKKVSAKKYGQVLSSSDAATITEYMKALVSTNLSSAFGGLNAAGKTGTADHTDANGNLATPHSWFIGFAPADNPKVVVAVIVENGNWGATSAAPVAAAVIQAALK